MRRLVAHGWRYFRRHGVRAAARAFVKRFVYRSSEWLVFHASLAGPPAADHVDDVVFRRAMIPEDLDRLDQLEPYGRGASQRAGVLRDNDWLFVAVRADRIVGTRRYTRALSPYGVMARVVTLKPGQLWMDDTFCVPEYRNRGITRRLGLFADRYMNARQYTDLFTSIELPNPASVRMALHKGDRALYRVSYFRLLWHERLSIGKPELTPVIESGDAPSSAP